MSDRTVIVAHLSVAPRAFPDLFGLNCRPPLLHSSDVCGICAVSQSGSCGTRGRVIQLERGTAERLWSSWSSGRHQC